METNQNYIEDIAEIKKLMEKSSRFLSLSGLSGISAGIIALIGAIFTFFYFNFNESYFIADQYYIKGLYIKLFDSLSFLIIEGIIVLVIALSLAIFFTIMRARKASLPLWDNTSKRLIFHLLIPLIAGGIFCFILIYHQIFYLVAPVTLIFYGLALLNASKFTLNEIKYLGISEIVLGLISAIFIGYGLVFWALGFGILHIIYGSVMYWKYEK